MADGIFGPVDRVLNEGDDGLGVPIVEQVLQRVQSEVDIRGVCPNGRRSVSALDFALVSGEGPAGGSSDVTSQARTRVGTMAM